MALFLLSTTRMMVLKVENVMSNKDYRLMVCRMDSMQQIQILCILFRFMIDSLHMTCMVILFSLSDFYIVYQ